MHGLLDGARGATSGSVRPCSRSAEAIRARKPRPTESMKVTRETSSRTGIATVDGVATGELQVVTERQVDLPGEQDQRDGLVEEHDGIARARSLHGVPS